MSGVKSGLSLQVEDGGSVAGLMWFPLRNRAEPGDKHVHIQRYFDNPAAYIC
jgi:hypothetical protein